MFDSKVIANFPKVYMSFVGHFLKAKLRIKNKITKKMALKKYFLENLLSYIKFVNALYGGIGV